MITKLPYTGLGQQVDIEIRIRSNSLSEYGEALPDIIWTGKGDFFEASKESVTTDNPASSKSTNASTILVNGDPIGISSEGYVQGEIKVNGFVHRILEFKRRRNPDGSIHHLYFRIE